ncbi:hypothetical protein [Antribacter gilvus]|uniref:hypothetical protein n=1 Tax=Antribacter gilvus TaxID=2304675 RepID=UPI000F77E4BE|nr:hypothetical protein [Antribacter gilvus]
MGAAILDLRSVKRAVRDGLAPHLEPLGMKPGGQRDGWEVVLSRGMSVAAVFLQFARPSRGLGLILSGDASKASCVRAEVGFGPRGGDTYGFARMRGTQLVPPHLAGEVRSAMEGRAARIVQGWVADPAEVRDDDFHERLAYAERRLAYDAMFYPLPDRREVEYWCSIAGPALAEHVSVILLRDAWTPDP